MMFIVILIALLIERFFDWSHLRHWSWYYAFQKMVAQRLPGKAPYLVLAAVIVPMLVVVLIIEALLVGGLYGLTGLLFQLFILLYCLGPQNLWADAFASITALTQGDMYAASEKLKAMFGLVETQDGQSLHKQLLGQIFIQAERRVFGVIFWYAVLGPAGALLYRTVALSAQASPERDGTTLSVVQPAQLVENVLDWLPVRIFTFLFALGGHFSNVLASWRKRATLGLGSNEEMLAVCGAAALGCDEEGTVVENGSLEREAISLLDRVFVIVLVIVAIAALLG